MKILTPYFVLSYLTTVRGWKPPKRSTTRQSFWTMISRGLEKREVIFNRMVDKLQGFRMWVNSLGVEGLYINNLYEEFKDGLALLKILDKVQPGSVDWKKVEKTPKNKFQKLSNTKMCVDVCKF